MLHNKTSLKEKNLKHFSQTTDEEIEDGRLKINAENISIGLQVVIICICFCIDH